MIVIVSVFLRILSDSGTESSSLLLQWQDTGGHVLTGVTAHGGPSRAFAV